MSAHHEDERPLAADDGEQTELELDDVDVRDLLRRALDPPSESKPPDILSGVQQRIRARSGGKFFADGWSTSIAPLGTYLVTSLLMLAVAVTLWLLLAPGHVQLLP